MIVCHCYGVTDREIRKSAQVCASRGEAISQQCSAGTACGGCLPLVQSIMAEASAPTGLGAPTASSAFPVLLEPER